MSSTVNMDMSLIGALGILPKEKMADCFFRCASELGCHNENGFLMHSSKRLGRLRIGERIVLQFGEHDSGGTIRKKLRDLFTRRAEVEQRNYINELEAEKIRLRNSSLVANEIASRIAEVERKQAASEKALQRQHMEECEAIRDELCEAAELRGYDVVEEKTEQGVYLQFIRREY